MRLQYFSRTSFLGCQLGSLISEREWRFAYESEYDFSLIALVDVLQYLFPVSDLGRRKIMNFKPEIRHSSLAHLLLMSDTSNGKKARLLLSKRERRNFGLLGVGFAINVIADCPRGGALELELRYLSNTDIFTSFERNDGRRFRNVYPKLLVGNLTNQ